MDCKDTVGFTGYDARPKSNYYVWNSYACYSCTSGTNGLEQIVYIGLSDGNFGLGLIAGIGLAIIAMTADRMTQAWSYKRKRSRSSNQIRWK